MAGIELANWYWKGVRQFVLERFGFSLSRSSCLNYLHRLGFVLKRPKNGSIPVATVFNVNRNERLLAVSYRTTGSRV